LVVSGY